jgi:hypothetical protein
MIRKLEGDTEEEIDTEVKYKIYNTSYFFIIIY